MTCVNLWLADLRWSCESLLSEYLDLLPESERAEVGRFRCRKAWQATLVGRALLRHALGEALGIAPSRFRFYRGPFGKPQLEQPADVGLSFNVAHTEGLAVCAVCPSVAVGVDVEYIHRRNDILAIARRFFARDEVADLESTPQNDRARAFFRFWTLKEAFIKATGVGLSMPLDGFSILWRNRTIPEMVFHLPGLGNPERWKFLGFCWDADHVGAVAVETSDPSALLLRARRCIPLRQHEPAIEFDHCWSDLGLPADQTRSRLSPDSAAEEARKTLPAAQNGD